MMSGALASAKNEAIYMVFRGVADLKKRRYSIRLEIPAGAQDSDDAIAVWVDGFKRKCAAFTCGDSRKPNGSVVEGRRNDALVHWKGQLKDGGTVSVR